MALFFIFFKSMSVVLEHADTQMQYAKVLFRDNQSVMRSDDRILAKGSNALVRMSSLV